MTETQGQREFRLAVMYSMMGKCTCGRSLNKQGKVCCRMCRDGYGSHSVLCRRNNPRPS